MTLRVLCLDIEGGFGGSSRSLYEALRHMDRAVIEPEVWCRRDGPIRGRYAALGIACRIAAAMPRMNSLPRLSRNLFGYARYFWDLRRQWRFRADLAAAAARFDLVHFNHEGLFLLASWLRRRHRAAYTMHVRTMIPRNAFGRWQCRRMAAATDRLVFITENERDNVEAMLGRKAGGAVIYNVAEPPAPDAAPHPAIPADGRLKVAVLSNYAYVRGIDRMVDVAAALAARGRRDILFVIAGDMALRGSLPGDLGSIARTGGTLADYAAAKGVADLFLFLGHVAAPETVLAGCQVLAKPTREDNPWGRDIIEGLAAGLPVISMGRYDRFVETEVTGFLFERFDAAAVADCLLRLAADRDLAGRLGAAARARIADLCNGPARARDLAALWRDAAEARAA
ncbi:MAG: glycosyltransferase family 4 protein [Rhodospirillaceae bacterium]|nr:glycosyltransferase family 4 protein [Rhodospirillaceae bacterium]